MAKISPVSIKYMVHASFMAEGALEKPDVIGALFGQTEGLLGADLEMRELQKEGKIGRIEVDLQRSEKKTIGKIKIPTALDQSETTLIAAAIETIERMGPSDSQIEIERIEDVRGSKRDYILERAKKLMKSIEGSTDSREISNEIKDAARISGIEEYGDEKLPCGDLFGKEVIVVEGRADVINLLRNGVKNVVAMNGTKLPNSIRELSKEKVITLFVDGDRGGKLIAQNVVDNAEVKYIAVAPDGKEVEELTGKEILMNLRKKVPARDFFSKFFYNKQNKRESSIEKTKEVSEEEKLEETSKVDKEKLKETSQEDKEKLKEIANEIQGSSKAVLLDGNLKEIKKVSARGLRGSLKRAQENPKFLVVDGEINNSILETAEEVGVKAIVAKKFTTTDTKIELVGF
ncbi:DNA primase DnaG [Nanoarchaeota archaeon]